MKFFLIFLFYFKNYNNNSALFSKKLNTYKKTSGNDERYSNNITEINEQSARK